MFIFAQYHHLQMQEKEDIQYIAIGSKLMGHKLYK
jgi:hypothetical protein